MGAEGYNEVEQAGRRERGSWLAPGDVLGDCEILGLEGFGAMGAVYRARQRSLGRTVALKVIREAFASTREYRERFLREARLAASVDHPHVVSVFDAGEHDGRLFLTMQWVEGEDLKRLLQSTGRLSPGEVVSIVGPIAGALEAIHTAGLIHRDVKPANIVVRDVAGGDHAYLTDFGLAKPTDGGVELTQAGHVLGTPGYMSPEQIEGGRPDARSDLYGLACVAFELLTGEPTFRRDSELALLMAHAHQPRPLASEVMPGLGTRYDAFFATALAIDPDERFGTGRELAGALRAAHAGEAHPGTAGAAAAGAAAVHPGAAQAEALDPGAAHPESRADTVSASTRPLAPAPAPRLHAPEAPPRLGRRRRRWPLALLALAALAGAVFGGLKLRPVLAGHHSGHQTGGVGGAGNPPPAQSTSRVISAPTQPGTPSPRYCGGDLNAGRYTTCGFARNVELAYDRSQGGDTVVTALSPVTGITYTLHCTGTVPHVCRGGKGASVIFRSGPADALPLVPCDPNISVGPDTSCAFGENVFVAYHRAWRAHGQAGRERMTVFSPRTGHTYLVTCTATPGAVTCSTGEGALITFPIRAVVLYGSG